MRKCSGLRPAWRVAATIGVVTLTATGVLTAAAKAKLTSPWRDRDIRVDGIGGEWRELQPLAKNVRWGIGLASDADHLYVALITSDALTTRQTLQEGLIVWFDAKGGKKRQFGIRYPTGMMGGPGGPRGGAQGEMGGGRGGELPPREGGPIGSPGTAADVGSMFARAEAEGRLRQLEILRDGHEDQPASIDAVAPLELKMGWREEYPRLRVEDAAREVRASPGPWRPARRHRRPRARNAEAQQPGRRRHARRRARRRHGWWQGRRHGWWQGRRHARRDGRRHARRNGRP